MICSIDKCNKAASFQIPFYKPFGKGIIVEFYEFRCRDHMVFKKSEKRKWSKEIASLKKKE